MPARNSYLNARNSRSGICTILKSAFSHLGETSNETGIAPRHKSASGRYSGTLRK